MAKDYQKQDENPFDDEFMSIDEADKIGYSTGEIDLPVSGRVTALPIPINVIHPDFRQPRRAIPMPVRGQWTGDPDELGEVLDAFHDYAEAEHGAIDVKAILSGRVSFDVPQDALTTEPIFARYANLILLAQNIANEGLTNPITVVNMGQGQYQIETGERRWLAFCLLATYLDPEKYGRIPAREVVYDPFRQASENNARSELSAIEMSRQVNLLIMSLLDDQHDYTPLHEMVLPGENDRRFYAQSANGYVHNVTEALRPKVQKAVRGLSWSSISNYKSLAALTGNDVVDDAIWVAADTYGWAESSLRELKVARDWDENFINGYLRQLEYLVSRDDWDLSDLKMLKEQVSESFTIVKLQKEREAKEVQTPVKRNETPDEDIVAELPPNPAKNPTWNNETTARLRERYMNKRVVMRDGREGIVRDVRGDSLRVRFDDGATPWLSESAIISVKYVPGEADPVSREVPTEEKENDAPLPYPEKRMTAAQYVGQTVEIDYGHYFVPGMVRATAGMDRVTVLTKSGDVLDCDISQLRLVSAPDKQSSQTLSDYYDVPKSPEKQTAEKVTEPRVGLLFNEDMRTMFDDLGTLAYHNQIKGTVDALHALKVLSVQDAEAMRAEGTLHEYLLKRYDDIESLLMMVIASVDVEFKQIDGGV